MNAALNDNSHLEFTQNLRRQLVAQYVTDGKFPDDPKLVKMLLDALKDHDKVTLTLKRLDAETENADADRRVLEQFHRISGMSGAKDFGRVDEPTDTEHRPDFNPNDIQPVTLVEGELEVGPKPIDYDELMTRLDKEHREGLA